MKPAVRIYTDGAFSPKTRIGGWAMVLVADRLRDVRVRRGAEPDTTNNRMELQGINAALYWALERGSGTNVILVTDSQYAIAVATSEKHYEINADLIAEIRRRIDIIRRWEGSVAFKWIKGHSGIYGNVLADRCACQARDDYTKRLAPKPR